MELQLRKTIPETKDLTLNEIYNYVFDFADHTTAFSDKEIRNIIFDIENDRYDLRLEIAWFIISYLLENCMKRDKNKIRTNIIK